MTVVEFEKDSYIVIEDEEKVDVTVLRNGDLSNQTTVHVVTKMGTAESPNDFIAKVKNLDTVVVFQPGKSFRSSQFVLCYVDRWNI